MATTRNALKIHSVEKHYEPNRPNNAKTVWKKTFILVGGNHVFEPEIAALKLRNEASHSSLTEA